VRLDDAEAVSDAEDATPGTTIVLVRTPGPVGVLPGVEKPSVVRMTVVCGVFALEDVLPGG